MNSLSNEGFVLVGGASSRMGRDKASISFRGVTLGEHAAAVLIEITDKVSVVGGSIAKLPSIDDFEHGGPRAAIHGLNAALAHAKSEWAAVLACDLPFVTSALFRRLIEVTESEPGLDAVVPRQPDGRLQPLAAIYRVPSCLIAVEDAIAEGKLSLRTVLDRLAVSVIEPDTFIELDPDGRMFSNVNTMAELLTVV